MKNVILTGGSGFTGSYCIEPLLALGYEVHNFDRVDRHSPRPGYFFHQVDLMQPSSYETRLKEILPTHLLHLAWYTEHGKFWDSPKNYDWLISSLQLVRSFYHCGGERSLLAGSCAEYDWSGSEPLHAIHSILAPQNLYGHCKKSLFDILKYEFLNHKSGMAWGRVFHLYGPGEPNTRLFPHVIDCLLKDQDCPCSHGNQWRDFIHVKDVGRAFATVLDSSHIGAFNISSGEPIQLKEIIQIIANQTGNPHRLKIGAIDATGQPDKILADITTLNELNFVCSINLDDGISDFINSRKLFLK